MAEPAGGKKKRGWLRRGSKPAKDSPAASSRRSDLMVAALGCMLGLICALFPWYIFLNPEKFGPQTAEFSAVPGLGRGQEWLASAPMPGGTPDKPSEIPIDRLDLFATGTTPDDPAATPEAPKPAEQPFPAAPIRFHVVHIENGRAMIEDDSGLFVVGRGDLLPDNSRVARIGNQGGRLVVITSEDKVLELTQ